MPFLTNTFLISPEQVERLYRPLQRIPLPPPGPVSDAEEEVATRVATEAPVATGAPVASPGDEPVWQALLDIQVWRTRPWWLRVVASLVVKRLGR